MIRLAAAFLIVTLVTSPRAFANPDDAASPIADLEKRRLAAETRTFAAAAWLDGTVAWEEAFPPLADLSLGDPDLLRIRLAAIAERGVDRAGQRVAPAPVGLTAEDVDAWRAAVGATTDAEDHADASEARFLSGLLAGLLRAPGLTDAALAQRELALPPLPSDPGGEIPEEIVAAHEEARTLHAWRRSAWRTMTRPGDASLATAVSAALEAQPVPDRVDGIAAVRIEAARDRLLRVVPLLDEPLAAEAGDWVAAADVALMGAGIFDMGAPAMDGEVEATEARIAPVGPPAPAETTDAVAPRAPSDPQIAAWRAELDRLRREHADAAQRTSLDRERQPQRDATFLDLRDLVGELHAAVVERHARDRVQPPDAAAVAETYDTVELLVEAKELRRAARGLATRSARDVARRAFIPEVVGELDEIPAIWDHRTERFLLRVASIPALLTDLTALYTFAARSVLFVVALTAWWFLRSAVPRWVRAGTGWLADADANGPWARTIGVSIAPWMEPPSQVQNVAPFLSRLLRRLLDLAGAAALLWFVREQTPVFHLLVTLLVAFAAWRVWPSLVAVVFATAEDRRPAFLIVSAARLSRVRALTAWFVGWWLVTACLEVLLLDVLAADKWAQLSSSVGWGFFLVLAVIALWIEEPDIRAGLTQLQPTPLVRRLAAPGSAWSRVPRAALSLVLLVLFHLGRWTAEILATSRNLRWVGTVLARRQLSPTVDLRPLDPEVRARVERLDHGIAPRMRIAVERVTRAYERWVSERTGMVAVIAERGAGLSRVPELLAPSLGHVCRVDVTHRISDVQNARTLLAEALGVPDSDEGFVASVQEKPSRSIIVSNAHLLFVRRAGGFEALRFMLEIMQATSEEHFWVWCANARTWAYLCDTPGAVDLGVFQDQIHVEPMMPDELGDWLLDPLSRDGLHASFVGLTRSGSDGVDPRAELRARRAYLRVLDDLSQGRPGIARSLWHASLRAGENGAIEHAVPSLPQGVNVDTLKDEDLFVLTALVVHAGLDLDSLSEVLNRPPARVQSACRRLEHSGVVIGDAQGTWFDVPEVVQPSLVRVLRQRAFLDVR